MGRGDGVGDVLVLFFIGAPFLFWFLGFGVNGIIGGRVHQKSIKGKRAGALALPALGRWGVGGGRRCTAGKSLRASPAVRAYAL